MKELSGEMEFEALLTNLPRVQGFVEMHLDEAGCPARMRTRLKVAVEEIFTNICSYAYGDRIGEIVLRVKTEQDPAAVIFVFEDYGMPFDPLAREDPNIHLPARERKIGGLGIYLTKLIMDDIVYEYRDGKNILTLRKNL